MAKSNNIQSLPSIVRLSPALKEALEEQQSAVGDLRSLIQCVQCAGDDGRDVEEFFGAMRGLLTLADAILMALDPETLESRARDLIEEASHAAEREARVAQLGEEPSSPKPVN